MDWYAFAAMAQRVLTGQLPGTDGVTPFVDGLAADPAQRCTPLELMAAIRREPRERWSSPVLAAAPSDPSDASDVTGRTSGAPTSEPEATGWAAGSRLAAAAPSPPQPAVTGPQDTPELPDQWVPHRSSSRLGSAGSDACCPRASVSYAACSQQRSS